MSTAAAGSGAAVPSHASNSICPVRVAELREVKLPQVVTVVQVKKQDEEKENKFFPGSASVPLNHDSGNSSGDEERVSHSIYAWLYYCEQNMKKNIVKLSACQLLKG